VDGPMQKLGLAGEDRFLFPVGKDGNLRWLELKEAAGNYTIEYIHQNPSAIGTQLGTGIDHISKLEYWQLIADGNINNRAKIELSFASIQSGGVTDPNYLQVAGYHAAQWEDAGHSGITGNFIQGSVLSGNTDFTSKDYTLASTVDLENPLPLTTLEMKVKEKSGMLVFIWTVQSAEPPDHFILCEENGDRSIVIARIPAVHGQTIYSWTDSEVLKNGIHYFRIRMVDQRGKEYAGKIAALTTGDENERMSWVPAGLSGSSGGILILSAFADEWNYEILSFNGCFIKKGFIQINAGKTFIVLRPEMFSNGMYIFHGVDSSGENHSLIFTYD
jgi:hypothetical protein